MTDLSCIFCLKLIYIYSNILARNGVNELWLGVSSTFHCRASMLGQFAAGQTTATLIIYT